MTLLLQPVQFPNRPSAGRYVALVSQASYHLDELVPIGTALTNQGILAELFLTVGQPGPAQRFRAQQRRYVRSAARALELGLTLSGEPRVEITGSADGREPEAVIAMTDWGVTRPLLVAARERGAYTFAKVEGAQDFDDANTDHERRPYRTAAVVLCQGQNDYDALGDTTRFIVGNSRIESIVARPATLSPSGPLVINSNFSYGVQTDHRKQWMRAALDACRAAERAFVVSHHPADRGLSGRRHGSREPIESLMESASGLISRFSSVGIEALARGIPLHYFNPHGERMGVFSEPMSGYVVTASVESLTSQLREPLRTGAEVRKAAEPFLRRQIERGGASAADRATEVIIDALSAQR